ncbi:MAG: hypothetical protein M3N29_00235 [Chloroflexota bacterium]|nr:hypothetical protein [Chloroflexota bacterium]
MYRPGLQALALIAALVAAACTTETGASPSPGITGSPTGTGPPATGAGATGAATVMLADSDLGRIVVDGQGMTLYGFVPDEASGEPTCYEQCAQNWPPLLVEGDFEVGEGLDRADFSTATRTDGGTQLKIGEYPLYYFANDAAAGDTNGQGVGGNWFVIGADGELIRTGG